MPLVILHICHQMVTRPDVIGLLWGLHFLICKIKFCIISGVPFSYIFFLTMAKWITHIQLTRKASTLCEISEIIIFHSLDKWKKVAVAWRINMSLLTEKKRTCDYNRFLVFNLFSIEYIIPNLFLFGINFTNWNHPIVWLPKRLGKRLLGKLIAIAKSMMYSGDHLFPPLLRMEIRVHV